MVVDPNDPSAWIRAATTLISELNLRARLGSSARIYAERTFDIERIADTFESVLFSAYKPYAKTTSAVFAATA